MLSGLEEAEETEAADVVAGDVTEEVNHLSHTSLGEQQQQPILVTREPNIQTCQLESGQGAVCIINMGKELFSALNLPPAPGKIFLHQDLPSEIWASLVTHQNRQNRSTKPCTMTSTRKYTLFVTMILMKSLNPFKLGGAIQMFQV